MHGKDSEYQHKFSISEMICTFVIINNISVIHNEMTAERAKHLTQTVYCMASLLPIMLVYFLICVSECTCCYILISFDVEFQTSEVRIGFVKWSLWPFQGALFSKCH